MCFPDKDEKWKWDVVKGTYINLGINLFEILYFPKLGKDIIETFVSFQNYDLIFQALKKGKGIFFLSGHISNWELQAFTYAKTFRTRLNIVVKNQSNKLVNKKINKYRELSGNEVMAIGGSLRNIYTLIKRNELVCFLMDQSAPPDYCVYANFFGKKVSTFAGPAKIALKNNTELIFGYPYRNKNYNYIIIMDKINYDDLVGGATEENITILTTRINAKLENAIREHPDQWLWVHRRFKHIKE
jgi:KDO2-lipid IV(A) lauroyltransferase